MRKVLISLLLAGAAASPALAAQHDDSDRHQTREERHESRSEARSERQQARQERQQVRSQQVDVQRARSQDFGARQQVGGSPRNYGNNYSGPTLQQRQQVIQQRRLQQVQRRDAYQNEIDQRREVRRAERRASRTPVISNVPRPGTQPPLRAESQRHPQASWNTGWRHDRRYDWSNWRHRNRSLFHLGLYIDPFGWGYQPYSIGWRLWPSYYSNRYWINDPWQYRLPYAPPGYQWIRYFNDALLVDTWSGQVVDAIPNFFW